MPETALGTWLKNLRNRRSLSLRELADRSGVDHAYIHRLEAGVKESPSEEVVDKLVSALAPSKRDAEILRFLVEHGNIDIKLVDFVREDPNVVFDEFHMLTTVVNRGARPDYATSLARIRKFMK
ncbi:helix-turn-helix domain-containing protein [Bradyrhizobium lablabi]|uniref:helix-turn-helix domain-containing protein n=1 Tax=Bradyrhizobium lablabi TaxID=722472 RepID=UPI001BA93913|nr:helix-turn-helix transcriptional regulator [Bradyrhizobium lablabi]MBR1125657.1 helix-turn-helix domain-containing protein [Bradyrhizobium lablabi]